MVITAPQALCCEREIHLCMRLFTLSNGRKRHRTTYTSWSSRLYIRAFWNISITSRWNSFVQRIPFNDDGMKWILIRLTQIQQTFKPIKHALADSVSTHTFQTHCFPTKSWSLVGNSNIIKDTNWIIIMLFHSMSFISLSNSLRRVALMQRNWFSRGLPLKLQ